MHGGGQEPRRRPWHHARGGGRANPRTPRHRSLREEKKKERQKDGLFKGDERELAKNWEVSLHRGAKKVPPSVEVIPMRK